MELFRFNVCYEVLGNFVAKLLKCWNDSGLFELVVAKVVSSNEMVYLSAFDRCCKDCIAVIIVQDKDIVVASTGDEWELAW